MSGTSTSSVRLSVPVWIERTISRKVGVDTATRVTTLLRTVHIRNPKTTLTLMKMKCTGKCFQTTPESDPGQVQQAEGSECEFGEVTPRKLPDLRNLAGRGHGGGGYARNGSDPHVSLSCGYCVVVHSAKVRRYRRDGAGLTSLSFRRNLLRIARLQRRMTAR